MTTLSEDPALHRLRSVYPPDDPLIAVLVNMDRRFFQRIDDLEAKTEARFERLETRMDSLEAKVDQIVVALGQVVEMMSQERS